MVIPIAWHLNWRLDQHGIYAWYSRATTTSGAWLCLETICVTFRVHQVWTGVMCQEVM